VTTKLQLINIIINKTVNRVHVRPMAMSRRVRLYPDHDLDLWPM